MPIIGLSARKLRDGRVEGWTGSGVGERDQYLDRVAAAGAHPVLLNPAPFRTDAEAQAFVQRFDAIVLTGGPDVEPHRYGQSPHQAVYGTETDVDDFEFSLVRAARSTGTPVLAICRGLQVLNIAFGGTLHQHIPDLDGVSAHGRPGERSGELHHTVTVAEGSRLASVLSTTKPTCSCHHHQSAADIAPGFRVVATAADGIVEAIEPLDKWAALAVQWHPEDTARDDPRQQALFTWIATEAAEATAINS